MVDGEPGARIDPARPGIWTAVEQGIGHREGGAQKRAFHRRLEINKS
jgi:hypothetical protein